MLLASSATVNAADFTVRTDRDKLDLNESIESLKPLDVDVTLRSPMVKSTPADKEGYTYVGTGQWKDDIFSIAIFNTAYAGLEWDVEIYESNDSKGKYLIANPYGDCPIDMIPAGEYSDIIVHTEKPELTYMEFTDMNMKIRYANKDKAVTIGSSMGRWLAMGLSEEDVVDFAQPGYFEDGVLTFAKDDMLIDLDGTRYTTNRNGLFQIVFPWAKDMSLELTAPTCMDEESFVFTTKAGKDVSTVKFMLIAGLYGMNDANGAVVAKNGDLLEATSGEWSLKLNPDALNKFYYTLLVVACDEDGNYVSGRAAWMIHSENNESEWSDFGKATYTDDIISSIYTFSYAADKNASYEVTVEQNNSIPGLFRIVNPYCNGTYYDFFNKHDMNHFHSLVIDASDPEKVEVRPSAIGFEGGGCGFFVESTASLLLENGASAENVADYYGKYDKETGVITLPVKAMVYGDTKDPSGVYYANVSGAFMLKFNTTSGISDVIDNASECEVEYYDLNGRKIIKPEAKGIYVIKQGGKVTKAVIR